MRVAHVISSLHPRGGGLPKTAAAMASSMADRGVETALIFFAGPDEQKLIHDAYGHFPGFDRIHLFPLAPGRLSYFLRGALQKTLVDFSPEFVHTHGLWEPLLAWAQRWALSRHVPYAVFPQSMLHPWQSRQHRMLKWILKNILGWTSRWKSAAFVQVLSEEERSHWEELGGITIRLIPNGIFPEEDAGDSVSDLPEWAKGRYILSLARLHPQKSPKLLLEGFLKIAEINPEVFLILAGPDYGQLDALKRQAGASSFADRIVFPGSISGAYKWTLLHRCSCFCLPSRAEGFSLAVLEAALAAAPLVISEGCAFPRLVEAGAARMTDLTAESIAHEIRQVLEQPGDMGSKARELVLQDYTWERITGQILAAYQEVGT